MKTLPVMIRIPLKLWQEIGVLAKKLNTTRQDLVREWLKEKMEASKK